MRTFPVLILPLLLVLNAIAFSAQATESWWLRTVFNTSSAQPSSQNYINDIDLMDCGDIEGTLLCSDLTQYYDLDVYVELELEDSSVETVRFNLPYSNLSYTKLQAYLRQDGFALSSIRIGEDEFDVMAQLEQARNEGVGFDKIDKQLIEFINAPHGSSEQLSIWNVPNVSSPSSASPWVQLHSDGDHLTVELNRF
ncbi:hypothetical protein AB4455_13565 [Vibrio sp. 10N.261.46.E12]|uniref:hypothetical protein n=1 Tax=unclassified Vibrio TaxID=2614977 RepID=UPI000976DFDE|nr:MULTISPECIES: hypothetical protein [unclassified Vibrio]OMO32067.1 hypothetical protein BH584_16965 [Vibrio sp. 10N.261.45.E1]PMJ26348.1 hypothetical protein BCU27_09425 [Vibrio sp. 10N.286.45.B6]PML83355.1 hypothetical protein BCT66_19330 [Vibrio sp. 10N.261.49.E11]PMM64057.1 hypothetical protein BCT48_22465 [Vibrio sp. 10N.261.46.F12]PMM78631.1 hypothetical protein BCT46_22135 [Vibrio sp. 10N.261.46.E8]